MKILMVIATIIIVALVIGLGQEIPAQGMVTGMNFDSVTLSLDGGGQCTVSPSGDLSYGDVIGVGYNPILQTCVIR